jgi:hypothetical protein
VETTGRQAEALRREIEELMVEDKTMSVTEIKVSDPMQHFDPESIDIKQFHPKEGASEGIEKVLSSCSINLPHLLYSY